MISRLGGRSKGVPIIITVRGWSVPGMQSSLSQWEDPGSGYRRLSNTTGPASGRSFMSHECDISLLGSEACDRSRF